MAIIIEDGFSGTDTDAITGRTPDTTDNGNTWAAAGLHALGSNSGEISGNQAIITTNNAGEVIDAETADAKVKFDWTPAVGAANRGNLTFRYESNDNFWYFNIREDNGDWAIGKYDTVGGDTTEDSGSFSWSEGTTYELMVICNGNSIKAYIDEDEVSSITSSTHNDHTSYGFMRHTGSSSTKYDNFIVDSDLTEPGASPAPSVSDSVTASEAVTMEMPDNLTLSVSETVTLSESTVDLDIVFPPYEISVSDSVTVTEPFYDLYACGGGGSGQTYSDDFDRSNESLDAGNWTENKGDIDVVSNLAEIITLGTPVTHAYAVYNSQTDTADNYSQSEAYEGTTGDPILIVRSNSDCSDLYFAQLRPNGASSDVIFQRINSGSYNLLLDSTAFSFSDGDTIKFSAETNGSQVDLTYSVNGTPVATHSDTDASRLTTGDYVGLGGAAATGSKHDNWVGGDINATPADLCFAGNTDSVTVTESVSISLISGSIETSATDTATVSEAVDVSLPDALEVSSSETVTVSEAVSISVAEASSVTPSASESINVYEGGWYNNSWGYRVPITVDKDQVQGTQNNFPVYVDLNDLPADFHTYVNQTDARDIRVTTADGVTEVPREVVGYNSASDTGELHFKGNISNSADTVFYIYFGNAGASDYATSDTYGAENVWSTTATWHFNEASNSTRLDSTSNSLDLTDATTVAQGTGLVGNGANFIRANGEYLSRASSDELNMGTGNFTVTALVKFDAESLGNSTTIVNKLDDASNPGGSAGWTFGKINTDYPFLYYYDGDSGSLNVSSTTQLTSGTWYHITIVRGGATDRRIYVDGDAETIGSVTEASDSVNNTNDFNVGEYHLLSENIDGIIDEIRLTKGSDLGGDYIKTEANNLLSAATFYAAGDVESAVLDIEIEESDVTATDTATISEAVELKLENNVSTSDTVTLTESVSFQSEPNISSSETVTISESASAALSDLAISVSDTVTIGEVVESPVNITVDVPVLVQVIESNYQLDVVVNLSASETVTISETTSIQKASDPSGVGDTVTISEAVTLDIAAADISVSESVTLSESSSAYRELPITALQFTDSVTVIEGIISISIVDPDNVNITTTDAITASESYTASVATPTISVSDSITVTDTPSAVTPTVLFASGISESITVTETFSPSYIEIEIPPEYHEVTVRDVTIVTESWTVDRDIWGAKVDDEDDWQGEDDPSTSYTEVSDPSTDWTEQIDHER